ncbi:FAD-binding protein, partial [Dawidia soli]
MSKIVETGSKTWENRHLTFTEEIDNLYDMWNSAGDDVLACYTKTSEAIQAQLGEAIDQGKTLRALGGGWTWTRIATCHKGRMYNTKGLNLRFSLASSMVDETYGGTHRDLLFVQCGVSVHELNLYLKNKGRALKTSGASNGQTIVGAMSTGTHGSAFGFGAVQDFVVGLHIITGRDPNVPEHNVY